LRVVHSRMRGLTCARQTPLSENSIERMGK
jgi:hypothetical protein